MDLLGWLVWWNTDSETAVQTEVIERLIASGIPLCTPRRTAPIDAFRNLAQVRHRYSEGGRAYVLETHNADPGQGAAKLVKHLVRAELTLSGTVLNYSKVGEAGFYPKGNNPRERDGRLVLRLTPDNDPRVASYTERLRASYRFQLSTINSQGLRRMMREAVRTMHGLRLQQIYFLLTREQVDMLVTTVHTLGGHSSISHAPLLDTPETRGMLSAALDATVGTDRQSMDLLEAYIPLGVIAQSTWDKMEESRG